VIGSPVIGFAVPDGDPTALSDAARWHEATADEFDGHASLIDHTAGSLTPVWQGEAASRYQATSGTLAAHFRIAADSSRAASAILLRYARELDELQQEGRRAMAQAQRWQRQVETDRARLNRAEEAMRAAEAAVAQAGHEMRATAAAGGTAAFVHAAAAARLADAQGKLAEAQANVRDAERALRQAEDELHHWQARGRQVWQEAQDAGNRASKALGTLTVPAPASPPAPATAPGPLSSAPTPAAAAITALVGSGTATSGTPIPGTAGTGAGNGLPAGAGSTTGGPSLPEVGGGAVQGALTFGDLEEIGHRFGWSRAELRAWWQVISDESGGNPAAVNASSGAFGIGQFLGATYKEYLPFGAGSPNPLDQLNAMAQYIHDRYGSPIAALAHECSCHWY
jgi:hypothetical protein